MNKFKYLSIAFALLLIWGFWWAATNHIPVRRASNVAIMKVHEIYGKVFIRENLRSGWDDVILEDSLRVGTEIQTLEDSQTNMLFVGPDGRVEIGPNSLVSFGEKDNNPQITFQRGELYASFHSVKEKERLRVTVNDAIVEMHDSDIFIFQDEQGIVNLSIPYGSIRIQKGENTLEFTSGQVVKFTTEKTFTVSEPEISMFTPLNFDRYTTLSNDPIPVRFAWSNKTEFEYYQIFTGPSIRSLKMSLTLNRPKKNEVMINLKPGIHYFRIYGFDGPAKNKFTFSDLNKIVVLPQATIQPLLPTDNAQLDLRKEGTEVKFQWDNPSQFEKLFLEVAKTANFKDLAFHETIQGANFLFVNFEREGEYFWRINGFPNRSSKLILGPTRRLIIK